MKLDFKKFRLSSHLWHKREFDPASKEDLIEYQYFLTNSKWKNGCPFIVEWPFLTVIDTIQSKVINQHMNSLIKQAKKVNV
jgi:hypothetical protein